MKFPIKKTLLGTALVCSLSASTATYAAWPVLAWAAIKTAAVETVTYFATEGLFEEDVKKEDLEKLTSKIKELETKLAEQPTQESSDSPSKQEFEEMQKLVGDLNTALAALKANSALPPTQRVDKMRIESAPLRDFLTNQNTPPEQRKMDLNIDVNYVYRAGGQGQAKPLQNNGVMQSGDIYKVVFTPKQFSYVYVFQVDSSGKIQQLFPMSEFKDMKLNNENPVHPNKIYYIPAEDKSFRLDNQTGTEKIYFLASRGQDIFIEEQYKAVLRAQQRGSGKLEMAQFEKEVESKGFSDVVDDPSETSTTDISIGGDNFSLLKKRLEGACNGCVNVLTFEHK